MAPNSPAFSCTKHSPLLVIFTYIQVPGPVVKCLFIGRLAPYNRGGMIRSCRNHKERVHPVRHQAHLVKQGPLAICMTETLSTSATHFAHSPTLQNSPIILFGNHIRTYGNPFGNLISEQQAHCHAQHEAWRVPNGPN